MKRYRSKISSGLVIFLLAVMALPIYGTVTNGDLVGLVIVLSVFVFVIYIFISTHYTIANDILWIQCGFMKKSIPISRITEISPSKNPISSPAASLDRLKINYLPNNWILVSPANKAGFCSDLKRINPSIDVDMRIG
jgi:hypothetical protein